MAKVLRRFLVVAALMFWQGGFVFYAAVVVPIGAEVQGSHFSQGLITRQVTNYLNGAGLVAVAVWAWDVATSADAERCRRRSRWAILATLLVTLLIQFWLHVHLDSMLDANEKRLLDKEGYRATHQWYLITSTVQWAAGLAGLFLSMWAWRAEDWATKNK